MTTTTKDITEYLDMKDIEYNPIRFTTLLSRLDWEQLEDLLSILKDISLSSEYSFIYNEVKQRGYDQGYEDGYANGRDED